MKHTPSPWKIDNPDQVKYAINAGEKHIAMINVFKTSDCNICVDEEESLANARLIVEAPELLKALEMSVKFIDSIIPQLKHVACDIGLLNDVLCLSRPMINRIHGE